MKTRGYYKFRIFGQHSGRSLVPLFIRKLIILEDKSRLIFNVVNDDPMPSSTERVGMILPTENLFQKQIIIIM